jgi:hypothetical protein
LSGERWHAEGGHERHDRRADSASTGEVLSALAGALTSGPISRR